MEAMRSTWTDERMDDLLKHIDEGFARVDSRFTRVEADIAALRLEFSALNQTLIRLGWGAAGTFAVGFAGVIATMIAT